MCECIIIVHCYCEVVECSGISFFIHILWRGCVVSLRPFLLSLVVTVSPPDLDLLVAIPVGAIREGPAVLLTGGGGLLLQQSTREIQY